MPPRLLYDIAGINLDAVIETSRWLGTQLGKGLPGMLARAGDYPVSSA